MTATVDQLVSAYRKLRDKKAEIKARHSDELHPYNEKMQQIENRLAAIMLEQQSESIKTGSGTCYKTTTTQFKIVDKTELINHILSTGDFHLLDLKVNVTSGGDYLEENQRNVPGTESVRRSNVRVRA